MEGYGSYSSDADRSDSLINSTDSSPEGASTENPWSYWREYKIPEWLDLYCKRLNPLDEPLNGEDGTDDEANVGEDIYIADLTFPVRGTSACPTSRRPSELDEDYSYSEGSSSRKTSQESREGDGCNNSSSGKSLSENPEVRHSDSFIVQALPPYDRQDSLLEAVLAAKMKGWNGFQRTESIDSGSSYASSFASSYCTCDDCFLGLSDKPLTQQKDQKTKTSHWRKVRNVVQWTPFIQTYKRHKYPWVQLAGHQGNFKAGHRQGTIMKKLCPAEEKAFEAIGKDALKSFVPDYLGVVEGSDCENYLQLQDLLTDFSSACVMDIKMGVRTYLEEELAKARIKPKLRKDMYEKMVQIDGKAPTEAEHNAKAVTKPRYMVWRETISSTATLGFRIEGVRRGDGSSSKDFKTTRTREQVVKAIAGFVDGYPQTVIHYIQRLRVIKAALEKSKFFKTHELIGSSLLFVHNEEKSGIWLIDFAKTIPLPDSVKVSHNVPWIEGTHEDGYLIGLDNLIELFECILENPLLMPSNNLKDVKVPEERAEEGLSADTSHIKKVKENPEEGKSKNISNNQGGGLENNLKVIVDKDNNTVLKDSGKPNLNAFNDALCSVSSKNVANAHRTESLQQND